LLDAGAAVNAFDLKEEQSALMHAADAGNHAAATALLDRGADPNAMTEWFLTALRIAERRGDAPMIELLRARGAVSGDDPVVHVTMPWATYSTGLPQPATKLASAIASDDVATLARLGPANGFAALCEAAAAGAPHCVAYLLACGIAPDVGGKSALEHAIRAGATRAVRLLLAASSALDPTITLAATDQSDPWILAAVLDRGAPVDTPVHGRRPLELAAMQGRSHQAAQLVVRGARIDEDLNGSTPLSLAARLGQVRCVEVLVDHELASGGLQHVGAVRRIDVALLEAAEHPRVIEALIRRGANPLALDRDGNSLLHLGASSTRVPIDLHLRLAGHYLHTPGRLGWTPLHNAAIAGAAATLATLIAAGADVDARDRSGRTPLHIACTYPQPAIVEALLASGADLRARDDEDRTALERAEAGDYGTHERGPRTLELLRAAAQR
jgi:ankyrin repeat protein